MISKWLTVCNVYSYETIQDLVAIIQLPAIDPLSCMYVLIKAQSSQEELIQAYDFWEKKNGGFSYNLYKFTRNTDTVINFNISFVYYLY